MTFVQHGIVVWMAVAAIVGGSLLALAQRDFKKMLTYLVVAEVGYMVGGVWLAMLVYAEKKHFVRVVRLFGNNAQEAIELDVPGATGMGPPAVCATTDGCVVAVPVEQDDRWRIACFFLDETGLCDGSPVFLDAGGSVNCTPALAAVGSDIHVVWQANAGQKRAIYSAVVSSSQCGEIVCLSAGEWNSQNPAIVDLGDGNGFAAWDSTRGDSVDIFGARLHVGVWGSEERLTSDARIERHPCLASHEGVVWMAWQAQAYEGRKLNHVTEQRIVLGRLDAAGVAMTPGWFDEISPAEALLVRPMVAFDDEGRLWLSYRRSEGSTRGWRPELRVHDGQGWSDGKRATWNEGRWKPVQMTPLGDRVLCAYQCDDLQIQWWEMGIWPDRHSWIELDAWRADPAGPAKP